MLGHSPVAHNVGTHTCGLQCWDTHLWPTMLGHSPVAHNVGTLTCGPQCWGTTLTHACEPESHTPLQALTMQDLTMQALAMPAGEAVWAGALLCPRAFWLPRQAVACAVFMPADEIVEAGAVRWQARTCSLAFCCPAGCGCCKATWSQACRSTKPVCGSTWMYSWRPTSHRCLSSLWVLPDAIVLYYNCLFRPPASTNFWWWSRGGLP